MTILERAEQNSLKSVKKLIAGRGDLEGNFYCVAVPDRTAGIIITLASKDPNGVTAISTGKRIKKEMGAGKFARGVVTYSVERKKLQFLIGKGQIPPVVLRRTLMSKLTTKKLQAAIKASLFSQGGMAEAGDEDESEVDLTSMGVGEDELRELNEDLDELKKTQEQLADRNVRLRAFMSDLSDESVARSEAKKALAALRQQETVLKASRDLGRAYNHKKADILSAIRRQKATLDAVATGSDPFEGSKPDVISGATLAMVSHISELYDKADTSQVGDVPIGTIVAELIVTLKAVWGAGLETELRAAVSDLALRFPVGSTVSRDPNVLLREMTDAQYKTRVRELYYAEGIPQDREQLDALKVTVTNSLGAKVIKPFYQRAISRLEKQADALPTPSDFDPEDFILNTCGSTWETVKQRLLTHPARPDRMWQMILYRKATVDGLLKRLGKSVAKNQLVATSLGSQNLTSDYDLTVSTIHGTGEDVDVVKQFNAAIKKKYKKQSGTVFDTNLYTKDFLPVKDTIIEPELVDEMQLDEVAIYLDADTSDQDSAALTKIRQYMTGDEWEEYVSSMLEGEDTADELRKQFDRAEARFLIKQMEVIGKLWNKIKGIVDNPTDDTAVNQFVARMDQLRKDRAALRSSGDGENLDEHRRIQLEMEGLLNDLPHGLDDALLETRNDLYVKKAEAIRKRQDELHEEKEQLLRKRLRIQKLRDDDTQDHSAAIAVLDAEITDLAASTDAKAAVIKDLVAEANFFAAEAYLSEGPLQHIVRGNQANNPEVFAKLKPEHFLGSINEQFGDFFKDVGHYGDNHGKAFYKTAKYIHRIFDGIEKLSRKDNFDGIEDTIQTATLFPRTSAGMMGQIDTHLMPIRGAKGRWAAATDGAKNDAALAAAPGIYGVGITEIGHLKAQITILNKRLNVAVRKLVDMNASQASDTATTGVT